MYCARGRVKYTLKRIVKHCSSRFGAEVPKPISPHYHTEGNTIPSAIVLYEPNFWSLHTYLASIHRFLYKFLYEAISGDQNLVWKPKIGGLWDKIAISTCYMACRH